jgi:hypothetical protein
VQHCAASKAAIQSTKDCQKAIATGHKSRKKEAKAAMKAAKPLPDLRPKPHLVAFVDILGFGHELEKAKTEADLKLIYAKVRKVQEVFQLANACDESEHQFENNAGYGRRVLALSNFVSQKARSSRAAFAQTGCSACFRLRHRSFAESQAKVLQKYI